MKKNEIEKAFDKLKKKENNLQNKLRQLKDEEQSIRFEMEVLKSKYRELTYPPKFDKDGYVSVYDSLPVLDKKIKAINRAGNEVEGMAYKFDYEQPVSGSEPRNISRWRYV